MRKSLFDAAARNSDNTKDVASAGHFTAWVEAVRSFSANMSGQRLISSLELRQFECVHEWALRTRTELAALIVDNEWLRRRALLESMLIGGEKIFYAALNLGDAGLCKFGLHCVVFHKSWPDCPAAVVPGDSARRYWDETCDAPRLELLFIEARLPRHVAVILAEAVAERGRPFSEDPAVCHEGDWYVELLAEAAPSWLDVDEVRVDSFERKRLLVEFAKNPTLEVRANVNLLLRVTSMLRVHGVPLKVVAA